MSSSGPGGTGINPGRSDFRGYSEPQPTCQCHGQNRFFTPLAQPNPRAVQFSKDYFKGWEKAAWVAEKVGKALAFGSVSGPIAAPGAAYAAFTATTLTAGPALLVAMPLATFAMGLLYLGTKPSQRDYDLTVFLADECIGKIPTAKDDRIYMYVKNEWSQFESYQCSIHDVDQS